MSRRIVFLRSLQIIFDLLLLSAALGLAVLLRFEGAIPTQMLKRLVVEWPYVVGLQYALLAIFGVPRFSWRYVGLREAVRILQAIGMGALILASIRMVAGALLPIDGPAQYSYLPYGVITVDCALAFLGISGARVLRRITSERAEIRRLLPENKQSVRTLLVGAGRSGVMVAKEIAGRPELGILPVGFIDDDRDKRGSMVHGVRVLGSTEDLQKIAHDHSAKQAIITVSNAPGSAVRRIAQACQQAGLQVKVIPGLYRLVGGQVNLTSIRDVAIEDLLRREAVVLDDAAIAAELRDRVVLVTGAGGSIGSEICRQVSRFRPARLVLCERSENALFEIHRELREAFPDITIEPCLADITERERIEGVFASHRPQVVFHAAAHKHVPMMEWNPNEAVKNNALGTRLLADCAHASGVEVFVMISTDKAINPTSVMGATKRVAELYVQALGKSSSTRFVTVRFGNVLGSNGSVVPIFKEQIARGGPLTVTHPDMKRYFMTIPEACQLVLEASAMGRGGEIFILDMGEPVKIVDLARDLLQLSGYGEGEIEIVFTGVRPGEKLYEELSTTHENAEKTRHPKIFIGKTHGASLSQMHAAMRALEELPSSSQPEQVRRALRAIVPEYSPTVPANVGNGAEKTDSAGLSELREVSVPALPSASSA
ncbi:MAG TPA: nucleoside-diphosphate sugar epimerase/dehydratase [Polyangiaceae bacterium]|nr:nucleoside-diphosphate sugar epimerase/dehydratase [Polyangiaceae bacterium]